MNLLGGKIAGAIKGNQVMVFHKHHVLKHFASLEGAKDTLVKRTERLGHDGIEDFAHGGIAGHPLHAIDPL
jgi:hypothetical protein